MLSIVVLFSLLRQVVVLLRQSLYLKIIHEISVIFIRIDSFSILQNGLGEQVYFCGEAFEEGSVALTILSLSSSYLIIHYLQFAQAESTWHTNSGVHNGVKQFS